VTGAKAAKTKNFFDRLDKISQQCINIAASKSGKVRDAVDNCKKQKDGNKCFKSIPGIYDCVH